MCGHLLCPFFDFFLAFNVPVTRKIRNTQPGGEKMIKQASGTHLIKVGEGGGFVDIREKEK